MPPNGYALLIGNSDGIGLEVTKRILKQGYRVIGVSRSESPVTHEHYEHVIQDVSASDYKANLNSILSRFDRIDVCIYFAGIGSPLNWQNLSRQTKVFEVNLMGAVITTELALSKFGHQGFGHFVGLSSLADSFVSSNAPSYNASKSGISCYWEGLGLSNKNPNIKISNVRFGFVDTKMAKSKIKPFLLTVDEASSFVIDILAKPKLRATKPLAMVPVVWILQMLSRVRILFR